MTMTIIMLMTPTQQAILWFYAAAVAIWPIRYIVVSWATRRLDILTPRSPGYHERDAPLVTAIIPAKDEEESLPGCLQSVISQNYPNLEILIVDDRSDDRTPEIARSFAAKDARVRVATIAHLPPGWTG